MNELGTLKGILYIMRNWVHYEEFCTLGGIGYNSYGCVRVCVCMYSVFIYRRYKLST